MKGFEIRCLGGLTILKDGILITDFHSVKSPALICYLAMSDRPQSRSILTGLFWPDLPEDNARMNLRKALSDLRDLVGDYIIITRDQVALQKNSLLWMDIEQLEQCSSLVKSKQTLSVSDIEKLAQTINLYQGEFLEGFYIRNAPNFEDWVRTQQTHFQVIALRVLQFLTTYYTNKKQVYLGLDYAKRWLSLDPTNEEAHREYMKLLAFDGRRNIALDHYASFSKLIRVEYGISLEEETMHLVESIRNGGLTTISNEVSKLSSNLPVETQTSHTELEPNLASAFRAIDNYSTPFVGRRREIREIRDLLAQPNCRFLTIGGLSGIGKTRLAIESIKELVNDQPIHASMSDGILFIPLVAVPSTDSLISAIAENLNFRFYKDVSARTQLLNFLRGKHMLVVLDNFEHLLESIDFITELLHTAQNVKLLITCTEPLNVQEEWFYQLNGLTVASDETDNQNNLEENEAFELFAQAAQRARVGFSVNEEKEHIIRICRSLEGMPLAIELAAAWLRTLPCEQVYLEIQKGNDLLISSAWDVPDRHRSIRIVFDQSWNQLSTTVRKVFAQLSIFRGGFCLEAAEQIAGTSPYVLSALVAKSLITMNSTGRYQMHELVRRSAAQKLREVPKIKLITLNKFQSYYLNFLEQREFGLYGDRQKITLKEIQADIENIRESWERALTLGNILFIERAMQSLYQFYQIRCRFQEGLEVFSSAANQIQKNPPKSEDAATLNLIMARILARQGAFLTSLGSYQIAKNYSQKSLDILQNLDDKREVAFSLNILGYILYWQGNISEAKLLHQKSLSNAQEIGDKIRIANALFGLGETIEHTGPYNEAKHYFLESLHVSREIGHQDLIAHCLDKLGSVTFYSGDYERSMQFYRESLALSQELEDRLGIALAIGGFGYNAWGRGEDDAERYYRESLHICEEIGHLLHRASRSVILGRILNSHGDYSQGKQFCQEGYGISLQIGNPIFTALGLNGLGEATCAQGEYQLSRQLLTEALKIAMSNHIYSQALESLAHYAHLLLEESKLDIINLPTQITFAAKLLTLVINNPTSWRLVQTMATKWRHEINHEMLTLDYGDEWSLNDAVQAVFAWETDALK